MTLFRDSTHQAIWIEHHCERCFHGLDCPILEKALTSGRKPPQWERNQRAHLMQDSIKCNSYTKRPPKLEVHKDFEDVPMFDVEPAPARYVPVEGAPDDPRRPNEGDHA